MLLVSIMNRLNVKKMALITLAGLASACSYAPVYNGNESYSGSAMMLSELPRHTLDYFIEGMTDQLIDSNHYLTARTPLAVTSIVELQSMDETNWLGNVISETFIYQMQQRGYTVVDYKTTGAIRVTPEGDFALSRNWQDLAGEQQVDYVLTGTMLRQAGGVMLNVRVVGLRSRVVIASAQGFLPSERIGRDLDDSNRVRIRQGMIIREDANTSNRENVILKP